MSESAYTTEALTMSIDYQHLANTATRCNNRVHAAFWQAMSDLWLDVATVMAKAAR